MSDTKRVTIPVPTNLKDKLELIAKGQRRSMSANLEHALEVYAALFDNNGKMLVPIDSILMGNVGVVNNMPKAVAPVVHTKVQEEVKEQVEEVIEEVIEEPVKETEQEEVATDAVEEDEIKPLNTNGVKARKLR